MAHLDCNTPVGRKYIKIEHHVANVVCQWFDCNTLRLGSDSTRSDRIFYRGDSVVSVAEIKARELSLDKLRKFGSYLVSESKIIHGCELAKLVHAPFFLFVYLIQSRQIVWWKIADSNGEKSCNYQVFMSETKDNCNGGTAVRRNAYINLSGMNQRLVNPPC